MPGGYSTPLVLVAVQFSMSARRGTFVRGCRSTFVRPRGGASARVSRWPSSRHSSRHGPPRTTPSVCWTRPTTCAAATAPAGRSARAAAASATAPSANAASSRTTTCGFASLAVERRPRCTSGTGCEHSVRLPCLGCAAAPPRRPPQRGCHDRGRPRRQGRAAPAVSWNSPSANLRRHRRKQALKKHTTPILYRSPTPRNALLLRRLVGGDDLRSEQEQSPSAGVAEQREPRPRNIGGHPVSPTAPKHPGRICGGRRHSVRRRFGLARARRGRPG